ncbi:MAG: hypothetical protein NC300_12095 [Bacteroidales bacterium]|nr:hypothetical protein [Clostridium sp.]MCM1204873.1 hypothetical protein [Bacteroidales bacterium]
MSGITVSIFLGALIVIAVIAMSILLGIWTYRDAQSKGMNGVLWTAAVLLVPSCIGLIIYLIVRMDNNKVTCSKCHTAVNAKNRYCSNCGMELVPVMDSSGSEETFKKSQRNILIGFFASLAAIIILSVFMIAFLIMGALKVAKDTVKWVSRLDAIQWEDTLADTLEDALGDIDILFDEDEIHVSINEDGVTLTGKDGKQLVHVDEDGDSVDVDLNMKEIKDLLDKYHIHYDENFDENELEREIRKEIREALEDTE